MNGFDSTDYDLGSRTPERPREGRGLAAALAIAVLLLAAAAGWYALRRWRPALPPTAAAPAEAPAATAPARAPGEPLPPLAGSDPFVRRLVGGLASHPQLAAWLVGDDLARRFVVAVVAVAEGRSPSKPLEPLTPPGGFRSRTEGGRLIVDPSSFERYDLATEVFVSIDTAGAAEAYRRLHPLFDQAYREVGDPASTFDATLSRAIATLVAVPIPEGPVELVDQGGSYHFADRGLEQRTVAEKHLLRIGPDNARRIQAKLSELAAALALPPA